MPKRDTFPSDRRLTAPDDNNGAGTTALVLSLTALLMVCSVWLIFLAIPVGAVAALYGVVGVDRARRGHATNGGTALAGLVLGFLITLATGGLLWVRQGFGFWMISGYWG
ncbi:DUF4190 domain-containing protein [Streptomyces sp. NPDC051173]|uniref:DUF4190 domain-containing protein n=1 Tax=Streptomyces sp. NPDC051173 TaxID=3155164 RepID=UPI00344D2446